MWNWHQGNSHSLYTHQQSSFGCQVVKEWHCFLLVVKTSSTKVRLSLNIIILSTTSLEVLFTIVLQLEGIHLFPIRKQKMRCLNLTNHLRLPSQWSGVSLSSGASHVVPRQACDADLINNTDPTNPPLHIPTSPH